MKKFGCLISALGSSLLFSSCATSGPKVVRIETPEMPLVRAALYFPFGSGTEASGQEGATLLVARWMEFGTQKRSLNDFNNTALGLGASLETSINPRFTLVSVEAPADKFPQAWELALEKLRAPKFEATDLETARQGIISAKRSRLTNALEAGLGLGTAVIYAGMPEAHSQFGTEAALKSLTAAQLKEFHSATFGKGPALVLVSKSLSEEVEATVRRALQGWSSSFSQRSSKPLQRKGRHLLIVERPGSTQAYLFFAKPGPVPGTDEHALASIGTQILGSNGGNSSILFDELRAKRGLTYHASIQTAKVPNKQSIYGVTFGANEKIGELASTYLAEWKKFYERQDIPDADLKEASVAYKAMRDRDSGETIGEILRTAAESFSVSGDVKPVWADPPITQATFNEAKAKWLAPDDFTLLVLGDSTKVRAALEKALAPVADTRILPANSDWDAVSQATAAKNSP